MKPDPKRLGRRHAPDPRDRQYLLKALRNIEGLPEEKYWNSPGVYDQGNTSQCVAYSTLKWLVGGPVVNKVLPWTFRQFYQLAQQTDEWPGEEPAYEGTSVRAAFKVLQRYQFVTGYEWAFSHLTALKHLMLTAPQVWGTDWTEGMFDVDRHGFIRATGDVVGGHAYKVVGASRTKVDPLTKKPGAYRIVNSWGAGWGERGRCWLTFADAERLIRTQGEVAMGAEVKRLVYA